MCIYSETKGQAPLLRVAAEVSDDVEACAVSRPTNLTALPGPASWMRQPSCARSEYG